MFVEFSPYFRRIATGNFVFQDELVVLDSRHGGTGREGCRSIIPQRRIPLERHVKGYNRCDPLGDPAGWSDKGSEPLRFEFNVLPIGEDTALNQFQRRWPL